jgi:hypothetical protein
VGSAGTKGEGYEVRLEAGTEGLIEATEEGRDGNNCEILSELDVFVLIGGRRWCGSGDPSTTGEPMRKAVGTCSTEGFLAAAGEPAWRGEGNPSMAGLGAC